MDHLEPELHATVRRWDARGWPRPEVMVVAGSGLATDLGPVIAGPIPWAELLPFPIWGIEGHPLEVELLAPCEGRVVLYSRGRLHAYQGFSPAQVVFTVRLAALLGAGSLILTNSSGGLRPELRTGDLVVIRDHLNLSGRNPLWGTPPAAWGPQFPDLVGAYDPALRQVILDLARDLGIKIHEGIYAGLAGPSYETPAEVAMVRSLGADVVGMSTVLEVIAARHMGLRCACISLVSNPAAGVSDEALDHADVLAQGRKAEARLSRLLGALLRHQDLTPDA